MWSTNWAWSVRRVAPLGTALLTLPENLGSAGEEDGAEEEHHEKAQGAIDEGGGDPRAIGMRGVSSHGVEFAGGDGRLVGLAPGLAAEETDVGETVITRAADHADIGAQLQPDGTTGDVGITMDPVGVGVWRSGKETGEEAAPVRLEEDEGEGHGEQHDPHED